MVRRDIFAEDRAPRALVRGSERTSRRANTWSRRPAAEAHACATCLSTALGLVPPMARRSARLLHQLGGRHVATGPCADEARNRLAPPIARVIASVIARWRDCLPS